MCDNDKDIEYHLGSVQNESVERNNFEERSFPDIPNNFPQQTPKEEKDNNDK